MRSQPSSIPRSWPILVPAVAALLLAAGLSACTPAPEAQLAETTPIAHGAPGRPAGVGAAPELSRIYRLGIGDKIKVTVFGETELSGQFEVSAAGVVAMPLIGEIAAKGEGIHALRDRIALRLASGYLKDPKVSIEVLTFRPFYVHGEVRTGGEFPFKNGITLRDAVAIAGGYTYRAKHDYVLLIREGEQAERELRLPSALLVMPGDNIRIPERFF